MPCTRSVGALALAAALISSPPAPAAQSAHELQVVASKFQFTPSTIEVTAGEPVRLVVHSMDVLHGISIPKLKIGTQIPKSGDPVVVEFVAPAAGALRDRVLGILRHRPRPDEGRTYQHCTRAIIAVKRHTMWESFA
jgi:plastocyanin